MVSPARALAFDILLRVEAGAWAGELLHARARGLDPRDAALASEIVLGTLRHQGQIDHLIRVLSGREPARLDPEVRIALRAGIHQLRHLTRIPPHAAVGESVELTKRAGKRSATALVNAVLRKVTRDPIGWPDRATGLSHPAWLLNRWERQYGRETAERIALANLNPPDIYVRGNSNATNVVLQSTEVPRCFRVVSGNPAGLRIQDIGSQAVVPLLELEGGQTFLDLCAAPGGKTAQALESGVRAVACDVHLSRLRRMRNLGCARVVLDGTRPLPFGRAFDRILVDAPCSGTGTLARNPEIKWRLTPADIADLHGRQVALLWNALNALKPEGRLVYSTCSLEREENEGVVEEVGASAVRLWRRLPGVDPGDGFFAAVIVGQASACAGLEPGMAN